MMIKQRQHNPIRLLKRSLLLSKPLYLVSIILWYVIIIYCSSLDYANIVRKANPISSEPATTIPAPQPTKSNPVKESSPVASKNPPEATTNPVNFGVTLSQEVVKSSSQKPQDTIKADLPETSQNKTEPVAPLSFGAFSEPVVTSATKESIQSSSVKVEGTSSQSVIAEFANDQNKADSVTAAKTGKKSFIDVSLLHLYTSHDFIVLL